MNTRAFMVALCILATSSTAHAIDISPGDYAWVGDGKNLFLTYGQHLDANEFNLVGSGAIANSDLAVTAIVLRGVHY